MLWQLLLTAVGLWVLFYRWQRRRIYNIAQEIPSGLKSYPGIGHAYKFNGDDEVFSDPVLADVIYKNCPDKDETISNHIRWLIGNGSIYAPVSIWRPRRKILAPIFRMKNLNLFVKVFSAQSVMMTKLLNQEAGAGDFSIWKYLTTYAFDSVCETTLGVKLNSQAQHDQPFLKAIDKALQLVTDRMVKPWLYPNVVYKRLPSCKEFLTQKRVIYQFVDELIRKKRNELATGESDKKQTNSEHINSFLELMIEQSGGSKGYTDLELREEVLVLVTAGTDTSAVGAAFTVVMLSRYPNVQEKVFQELKEVFGNSDRPVTMEDLTKLKYLEVVIKESLRLYPPGPVTLREIHNDVKLPTGTTLVNGVAVVLHIWAIHRNPEYWGEDAEQYRPERFLEGPLRNPMQFLPFSHGNRNCLGYNYAMMSMKTVLANLLRRYRLLPPKNMDATRLKEPLRVKYDIMMKHVDNYYVRLEQRNYVSK